MIDAEIKGDKHPKTVTLVSDDKDGENAALVVAAEQWGLIEFEKLATTTPVGDDGNLRIEIPTDEMGEVFDLIEEEFWGSPAHKKINHLRESAMQEAEEALSGEKE